MKWTFVVGLLAVTACNGMDPAEQDALLDTEAQGISTALFQARCDSIRAVHAASPFLHNPVLFAGIAYTETGLAHCAAEYRQSSPYVCDGPYAADCGGPVTAGYWDNPSGVCSYQRGGLSMYQFDEGTYTDTINKWTSTGYWQGRTHNVLSVSDASSAAIDFVLLKAWYSSYTPYFSSNQAMYNWINSIRPVNGNQDYETWLGFLANSYNGQAWGSSDWAATKEKYRTNTSSVYNAMGGSAYWYGTTPTQPPGQPTGLSPDNWASVPSGWMTMTWGAVSGATSYEVYILYWNGSAWTYYYTYSASTNSVTISPYYHATSYAWNVKAKNSAGTGPQSNWAYFNEQ